MKNTKSPNIDGQPPILRLYFKVIGIPPVTGTPVGSRTLIKSSEKFFYLLGLLVEKHKMCFSSHQLHVLFFSQQISNDDYEFGRILQFKWINVLWVCHPKQLFIQISNTKFFQKGQRYSGSYHEKLYRKPLENKDSAK